MRHYARRRRDREGIDCEFAEPDENLQLGDVARAPYRLATPFRRSGAGWVCRRSHGRAGRPDHAARPPVGPPAGPARSRPGRTDGADKWPVGPAPIGGTVHHVTSDTDTGQVHQPERAVNTRVPPSDNPKAMSVVAFPGVQFSSSRPLSHVHTEAGRTHHGRTGRSH